MEKVSDNLTNSTIGTPLHSDQDSDFFKFDFAQSFYRPLNIGFVGRKTRLEELLEEIRLPYD
jgi:hypothetical protein